MQLIKNGPDIPDRLLEAHEEGRVVFFCGAGISYPANLPGFAGLVTKLYAKLHTAPNDIEKAAIKKGQYDTAIGLLEGRIVGGRDAVRHQIAQILTPDLAIPQATTTHEALLTLGRTRDGRYHLITTNFDRLFEEAKSRQSLTTASYRAPELPVPKNRWNGLVYLHGLLPTTPTQFDLDRIVVSSGDFGLAYLTERWAARFVSELFRSYTVCFVGYSIEDPVLRYMMDALAADRALGETPPEVFAFGSHKKGKEDEVFNEWEAKNVTPILYQMHSHHFYLHRTLREWATIYRDGILGKERIVTQYAATRPIKSTVQDDFTGRVVWALSHSSGLPAKRFAEYEPVPSLDWLEPFSEARFLQRDLGRFGVQPNAQKDEDLEFSLIFRPTPYLRAPWMRLTHRPHSKSNQWDEVMFQIARWLLRHLNDPNLLLWFAKQGSRLHPNFARLIKNKLSAEPASVGRSMRTLWQLVLLGRTKDETEHFDLYGWRENFGREGLTTTSRLQLRALLSPYIRLSETYRLPDADADGEVEDEASIEDKVSWEVALGANYVRSALAGIEQSDRWQESLPRLLPEFSDLLRDTLDLMRQLGRANDRADGSYISQPSISSHSQNRDFDDWTILIELVRDSWLATVEQFPRHADVQVEQWSEISYPLFRRLVFFAAANSNLFAARKALDWLLDDDHWWLWSVETQREASRLLVWLAQNLDHEYREALEQAILRGPQREMFKDDLEEDRFQRIREREIWLRLAKYRDAGGALSENANQVLETLSQQNQGWELAEDERDEFPIWMGAGDDWRQFQATPKDRRDLVEWLRAHPDSDTWQEDDWGDRCRNDFPRAAIALIQLTQQGEWVTDRWREALQAWSDDTLILRSWRYLADVLLTAPDDALLEFSHSLCWWLESLARVVDRNEETFFALIRRILALYRDDAVEPTDDVVFRAINHPVGRVIQAALRWWYRQEIRDNQGLHDDIRPIFTDACNPEVENFKHGRVVLGTHLIALFRVDRVWTIGHLLPFFDWDLSVEEARGTWSGFLGSPRLYMPLLAEFKAQFLSTAGHYEDLGEYGGQYASLFTLAALEPGDTLNTRELQDATALLPADGLEKSAQMLVSVLESSGEQQVDYWRNRILPYLQRIWPKTQEILTPAISEKFARLCIAADDAFPDAIEHLRHWLQAIPHPNFVVHRLHDSGLAGRFPREALGLLDVVIGPDAEWPPNNLAGCLEAIRAAEPALEADARYQRLDQYLDLHGGV